MDCWSHFRATRVLCVFNKIRAPTTLAPGRRRSSIYLGSTFLSLARPGASTLRLRHLKDFFTTGFNLGAAGFG